MAKIAQLAVAILIAWFVVQWLPSPAKPSPQPDPPGPVDPLDPEPDFSSYADKVYSRCMAVKSRTRKADCQQLSDDVQTIIDRIGNGTLGTNQAVVDALKDALLRLPHSWYGQVRKIADEVLLPLTKSGTLNSPQRWKSLLIAIKPGIDKAGAESTGVSE